jgi:hypothetical protein
MKVRAKFQVTKVSEFGYAGKRSEIQRPVEGARDGVHRKYESTGIPVREVTLAPQYDNSNPEDVSFAAATPSGICTLQIDNPAIADEFKPGDTYYIEFTRVEKQ